MVALKEHLPKFTPEEYFAWDEQQLEDHEYMDGEVGILLLSTILTAVCRLVRYSYSLKLFERLGSRFKVSLKCLQTAVILAPSLLSQGKN
jgi:hypothetical protein